MDGVQYLLTWSFDLVDACGTGWADAAQPVPHGREGLSFLCRCHASTRLYSAPLERSFWLTKSPYIGYSIGWGEGFTRYTTLYWGSNSIILNEFKRFEKFRRTLEGCWHSWLAHTPDKRKVGGSNPLQPTHSSYRQGRKGVTYGECVYRGYSSVGRALLLHGRCQRFESAYLHTWVRFK